MKRKLLFFSVCLLLCVTGCSKQVITVTGMQTEEGTIPAANYIEIEKLELKAPEVEYEGENVKFCAVMIPEGYHKSEEIPGMYVHERYPMEASNIYYTVSKGNGDGVVSKELTKETYEEMVEAAYKKNGQEVNLQIETFEEIDMDGVPGYKIRSSHATAKKEIEQLTYLILAEDTYAVTYSQLSDDEMMADFEISEGEIRLVKGKKQG